MSNSTVSIWSPMEHAGIDLNSNFCLTIQCKIAAQECSPRFGTPSGNFDYKDPRYQGKHFPE